MNTKYMNTKQAYKAARHEARFFLRAWGMADCFGTRSEEIAADNACRLVVALERNRHDSYEMHQLLATEPLFSLDRHEPVVNPMPF